MKTSSRERLFGTDGIRGRANVYPMSPALVLRLGQAIGLHFKRHYPHPRILIGKDTRLSGYMLEQALASGICSVGVHVGFLGPLPTPGIAYLTRGMRACAGIVISASHNPYHDNGIKIFSADGYKLDDSVEERLETMLMSPDLDVDLPYNEGIGTARRIDDAIGQYAVFLKEQFPKNLTLEGLRIVLDCANGAAYKVAPKVFEELGAELFVIGNEPNGRNINDQCGALDPTRLQERVRLYKADLGIAVDGDADRLAIVDHLGRVIDGDQILAICAKFMMEKGQLRHNTLVTTVMSNMGLEIAMNRLGVKMLRTKVGDRYVVEAMRQGAYNLGGEQSGHLVFHDYSTTGDGILAALHLLRIAVEEQKTVVELARCMDVLPQAIRNIPVPAKIPLEDLPELKKVLDSHSETLGREGRVVFRYSGTESVARIMVEGPSETTVANIVDDICDVATRQILQRVPSASATSAAPGPKTP